MDQKKNEQTPDAATAFNFGITLKAFHMQCTLGFLHITNNEDKIDEITALLRDLLFHFKSFFAFIFPKKAIKLNVSV